MNNLTQVNFITSVQGSVDYRYGTDTALNTIPPESIISFVTPNLNLPFSFTNDSQVPTN